jgi:hypothetical protein
MEGAALEIVGGTGEPFLKLTDGRTLDGTPLASSRTATESLEHSNTSEQHGLSPISRFQYFQSHNESMLASLGEAMNLRRRCLDLRRHLRQQQTQPTPVAHRPSRKSSKRPDRDKQDEAQELAALELQLEIVDGRLLRDGAEMHRLAPMVLNDMRTSLPIMLSRHRLDFRGDTTSSDDQSSTDFDFELDEPATELRRMEQDVGALEEQILWLRHQRDSERVYMLTASEADTAIHDEMQRLGAPLDPFPSAEETPPAGPVSSGPPPHSLRLGGSDNPESSEGPARRQARLEALDSRISEVVETLKGRRAELDRFRKTQPDSAPSVGFHRDKASIDL